MSVLKQINNLVIRITNPIEGLLSVLLDTSLEDKDESFLSNLVDVSRCSLEHFIELLDDSGSVS